MLRFLLICFGFACLVSPFDAIFAQSTLTADQRDDQFILSLKLGDRFFRSRDIPGNESKAMKYFESALRMKPDRPEVYWRMARTTFLIERAEPDPVKKEVLIDQGIRYGEKAVELAPKSKEAHLYLGAMYGRYVFHYGLFQGWDHIFLTKEAFDASLKIDPDYAFALIASSLWYAKTPWWLGGDKAEALRLAFKAIDRQPSYTTHYLYLSEQLIDLDRKKEAAEILRQMFLISKPFDPMIAIDDRITADDLIETHNLKVSLPANNRLP